MANITETTIVFISLIHNSTCAGSARNVTNDSMEMSNESHISDVYNNGEQPPLVKSHFYLGIVYCITTVFIIILGTFGNITIIVVTIIEKSVNKIGRLFIVNLALADLCVAAIAEPMCLVGALLGEAWFNENWFVSESVPMLCFTACVCAYLSLALQAFNRYLFVCRNQIYYNIYTTRRCIVVLAACWVFGVIFDSPNFLGWGDHNFDPKAHRCTWSSPHSFSYTLSFTVAVFSIFIPLGTSFILIFKKIKRCKTTLAKIQKDDPLRNRAAWMETLRSSRTLFLCFIMFMICWLPIGLLNLVDFEHSMQMEIYLFITVLAHSHSCSNFTIYMLSNSKFRDGVMCIIFRKQRNDNKKQLADKYFETQRMNIGGRKLNNGHIYVGLGKTSSKSLNSTNNGGCHSGVVSNTILSPKISNSTISS